MVAPLIIGFGDLFFVKTQPQPTGVLPEQNVALPMLEDSYFDTQLDNVEGGGFVSLFAAFDQDVGAQACQIPYIIALI